jgi:hypothetical protein
MQPTGQDEERRERKVPVSARLKMGAALGLAAIVVALAPSMDTSGDHPPIALLLLAGLAVGVLTSATLYLVLTRDLGLGGSVLLYTIAFNVVIVLVKFVLTPTGVYEVNEEVAFTNFINVGDVFGTITAAVVVFGLYALALFVIYRLFRGRRQRTGKPPLWERVAKRRGFVLTAVAGTVLLAMGGAAIVLLLPLVAIGSAAQYLNFVLSSSVSLLVALALAAASVLALRAFRTVSERAEAASDVALLVTFFWVALGFLAIYHVLWVIYLLVLTSIWPLKVVVPK